MTIRNFASLSIQNDSHSRCSCYAETEYSNLGSLFRSYRSTIDNEAAIKRAKVPLKYSSTCFNQSTTGVYLLNYLAIDAEIHIT